MNDAWLVETDEGYEGAHFVAAFSSEATANEAKSRVVYLGNHDEDYVYVRRVTVWDVSSIITRHWSAWVRDGVLLVNSQGHPEIMKSPVNHHGTVHVWADTEAEARVIAERMLLDDLPHHR